MRADTVKRGAVVRAALVSLPLVAVLVVAAACADRPAIIFHNDRDCYVDIHVDGDRVLILAPHTSEALPYMVAAWTWPRLIEVRRDGEVISSVRASAGDLANQHWRVEIR